LIKGLVQILVCGLCEI